ncbi:MAG TPA: hypothetical protein VGK32_02405 [Vicinamibacterales bacterium]|jgi:hypothetical protein
MTLVLFVAGGAAGVVFWNAIAGRFEGDRLERSLRIPVGRYYLHVHHWLYCLGIMALLYSCGVAGPGLCGFLSGSVAQGLTYRDWYLLVYDRDKGETLYSRWRS